MDANNNTTSYTYDTNSNMLSQSAQSAAGTVTTSYTYNSLNEPMEWVYTNSENRPNVIGRQPYGLIAIANSDAGASPHTDTAIFEAWRAVGDILDRRSMPFLA